MRILFALFCLTFLFAFPVAAEPPKGPGAEVVKPHLPTPPCPNCQCGCTVTGKCTCKDCDHPQLTPTKQTAPVYVLPFRLYQGTMENRASVGQYVGYPDLASAEAAAGEIARKTVLPVMVHDSAGFMVETVPPYNQFPRMSMAPGQYVEPVAATPQQDAGRGRGKGILSRIFHRRK